MLKSQAEWEERFRNLEVADLGPVAITVDDYNMFTKITDTQIKFIRELLATERKKLLEGVVKVYQALLEVPDSIVNMGTDKEILEFFSSADYKDYLAKLSEDTNNG